MKDKRHMRIKEIVSLHEIETQEDLVKYLEESGFVVTQATISRDVKELQLIKVVGTQGRYKYAIPVTTATISVTFLRRKLMDVFISRARTNNLVVIKLLPGNAQAIASMIDSINYGGLLGTIAGDDTILLVCQDEEVAINVIQLLIADEQEL